MDIHILLKLIDCLIILHAVKNEHKLKANLYKYCGGRENSSAVLRLRLCEERRQNN